MPFGRIFQRLGSLQTGRYRAIGNPYLHKYLYFKPYFQQLGFLQIIRSAEKSNENNWTNLRKITNSGNTRQKWGETGVPFPRTILYVLENGKKKAKYGLIYGPFSLSCD